MTDPFTIISEFLERCGGEVQGRSLEELPPPEVQSQIEAFARGTLEASSREALVQLLHDHPEWIGRLAEEVKSLRTNPGKHP